MKRSLCSKGDDALACHLLSTTVTVSNGRDSTEANDLIRSCNTRVLIHVTLASMLLYIYITISVHASITNLQLQSCWL